MMSGRWARNSAHESCEPKEEEGEADPEEEEGKLHAANPLLCAAKEGGRHRGKEISDKGGGRGVVPKFVPGFVPFTNPTSTTSISEVLPASFRIVESICTPVQNSRRQFCNQKWMR